MALKLTRDPGERLYVGEGPNMVVIEYTGHARGQGRFTITAPRNVRIDREEVRDPKAARRQREDYARRIAAEEGGLDGDNSDTRGNR